MIARPRVFVDTNALLHFKFPSEIDWRALTASPAVTVVFAPIVIRELDKHKNGERARLRKRAASVVKRLRGYLREYGACGPLSDGVDFEFVSGDPTLDYAAHQLDRQIADDVLIASMVEDGRQHLDVRLATADMGLEVKILHRGIACVDLPEEARLPDEEDPTEKEARELRARVSAIEAAQPRLKLLFENDGIFLKFRLALPSLLDADRTVALASRNHPHLQAPASSPGNPVRDVLRKLGLEVELRPEQISEYNDALDAFIERLRTYCDAVNALEGRLARMLKIALVLQNDGSRPAQDIDVFLSFPSGIEVLTERDIPNAPQKPEPPALPRTFLLAFMEHMQTRPQWNVELPRNVSRESPTVHVSRRADEGHEVRWKLDGLKHEFATRSPVLFVSFPSIEEAQSFAIGYHISAANLPAGLKGELHLVHESEHVGL